MRGESWKIIKKTRKKGLLIEILFNVPALYELLVKIFNSRFHFTETTWILF